MKNKILFVLVTHSNYMDICSCFIEMFMKNFSSQAQVEFIISYCGEPQNIKNFETLYNGKDASLPECLYNVANSVEADLYFSFLGDAFICEKVNNQEFEELIINLINDKIEYCCLIPRKRNIFSKKTPPLGSNYYRLISYDDIYCHSFIAFCATKEFILNEFNNGITDFEFENKYLKAAKNKGFYDRRAILRKNVLNIIPGIQKGKWDRKCYKNLCKQSVNIFRNNRKVLTRLETIKNYIILFLQPIIPYTLRTRIKKMLTKLKIIKFSTEN